MGLINQYSLRSDSAGSLGGYEILKVHDADPLLAVEVKFVDVASCHQFLESYSSGAVHQSFSQHACRLLALPHELAVETQLKASTHILDLCLDDLELCLQHIHFSQVLFTFMLLKAMVTEVFKMFMLLLLLLLLTQHLQSQIHRCTSLSLTIVL